MRPQSKTLLVRAIVPAAALLIAACGGPTAQQLPSNDATATPSASPTKTPGPSPLARATPSPAPTGTPSPPPPPAPSATAAVKAVGSDPFSFSPSSLSIRAGTRVSFTNQSPEDHTFSANGGAFESGVIAPGQSWTFNFASRGSFPYFCRLHPYMTASIAVS